MNYPDKVLLTQPVDSGDKDQPPQPGLKWAFPLLMELFGQQIMKGFEHYHTLLQTRNGRFMDRAPELIDALMYAIVDQENMREAIEAGRELCKAIRSDDHTIMEKAFDRWESFDNYPNPLPR